MNIALKYRKAIADLITNGELCLDNKTETYKGKYSHSASTMQWLISQGYAEVKSKTTQGHIDTIMPTEAAVNLIPVSM